MKYDSPQGHHVRLEASVQMTPIATHFTGTCDASSTKKGTAGRTYRLPTCELNASENQSNKNTGATTSATLAAVMRRRRTSTVNPTIDKTIKGIGNFLGSVLR